VGRLLLLTVALIVYGSLYPWHFDFGRAGNPLAILLHAWGFAWDRFTLRDIAINVALYVPLGAGAALTVARRHSRATALAAAVGLGMALSAAMEMLQLYVPGRDCNLVDVVSNTTGAAAGAIAALALRPEPTGRGRRWPGRSSSVLLLGSWLGYQLYPFFAVLSQTRLRAGLALLASPGSVTATEIWANAAEWFAAGLLMKAFLGRMRPGWLLAAMACLPVRILVPGRTLSLNEVLGAGLALLLWTALGPGKIPATPGRSFRPSLGLALLASAIVLRELAPFHLSLRPSAFSWVPFAAMFEASRQEAAIVLLQKTFDYGAAVWLLHTGGLRYARAGALAAAALAVLEASQRYLPGRTPEITDPVLALLATFALWCLGNFDSRRG
jgi:VanZ family protein